MRRSVWQPQHIVPDKLGYRFNAPPFFVNDEHLVQRLRSLAPMPLAQGFAAMRYRRRAVAR